jgi:hypothetical protein
MSFDREQQEPSQPVDLELSDESCASLQLMETAKIQEVKIAAGTSPV